MTPRQLRAFLWPCLRATDVHAVPRVLVAFRGDTWSTLLSVNR